MPGICEEVMNLPCSSKLYRRVDLQVDTGVS